MPITTEILEGGLKRCTKPECENPVQPIENFHFRNKATGVRLSWCKTCSYANQRKWSKANPERVKRGIRNATLKRNFGITLEDYETMLTEQNGLCAICGNTNPSGKSLHVDHDHQTDEVRGLLCFRCNAALGMVEDSPEVLLKMIDYLKERSL